jgi:hypothetical protein
MTEAKRDENSVTTFICASSADGETPVLVKVNPTSHILSVSDDSIGTDLSDNIASRDNNMVPVAMGVSSEDGVTPTPIYANSDGEILIDSSIPYFLLKEDDGKLLLESGGLIVT